MRAGQGPQGGSRANPAGLRHFELVAKLDASGRTRRDTYSHRSMLANRRSHMDRLDLGTHELP